MSYAQTHSTQGFGLENLPYGSFSADGGKTFHLGARLGDRVLNLGELSAATGNLSEAAATAVASSNLDALLQQDASVWAEVRSWLVDTLTEADEQTVHATSFAVDEVTYQLAFTPADYVDYYASEHHATNLGHMFRPQEEPLKPNWKHLPVGYHGRSGSIRVSGSDIVRPKGLRPPQDGGLPSYGPEQRLDIEAELGFVLGGSAPKGEVDLKTAADSHLFGVFLFNDWSARGIQNYEYVPLGPYLGKSFASTVGTWVVPWAALQEARVATPERTYPLASYLDDSEAEPYGLDITFGVTVNGEVVSRPPYKYMYWSAPQMVAHMTVNGAPLRPGDMFASGTISGPEKDERGSFIELSWGGKEPLTLADGHEMTFLEDGQLIGLTATAPGPEGSVIDFGDCLGTIVPATGDLK
ncbi:fumarylacetoacetate hydrolase family protein [Rothia nasimurium]|uniref:fumarylacetoacetate hydrolase family protein n=1 Tax=Rothia nasimurium TaxID=85336 RepID=UPI001EFF75BF|nr:fumarylacetoacetate hydrolase family protein [Rothia nasimurium]